MPRGSRSSWIAPTTVSDSPVFDVYQEWQRVLEREPFDLLERRLEEELAKVRTALGEYFGARPGDLVLLPTRRRR